MLIMIDGPMINRFVDDVDVFRKSVDDRFNDLDTDKDGKISPEDLRRGVSRSISLDCQEEDAKVGDLAVFERFDADKNGSIDREEFRPMMMELLVAVARGIGPMPVIVGAGEDSLLMKAYENELARVERKLQEVADGKGKNDVAEIDNIKNDLKRKKSKKIFGIGMCACSAKYLGED